MRYCKKLIPVALVATVLFGLSGCGSAYPVSAGVSYANPEWAPPYSAGVRYYYLPDIETYYDLSNNDFVYMDDGQWRFSASLPGMYDGYDLYNGFEIALNRSVYQPWLHNQYYSSNYPRYYYRNKYHATEGVRGFNENVRQPIYRNTVANNRPNPQQRVNGNQRPPFTRPAQMPSYRGKNIGQPVKVRSNMRQSSGGGNRGGSKGGKH